MAASFAWRRDRVPYSAGLPEFRGVQTPVLLKVATAARATVGAEPCIVRSPGHRRQRTREDAMIVADVSFADIFWSVLWFFFLFIWIMILVHILSDLFRDHTLSGGTKTLWVLFLVFLPFLAVLVYLIVRGKGMAERAATRQQQAQEQFEGYVRNVATTSGASASPTEQIAQAKQLLDAGTIDQAEFERLKAKALA
jgi:Phospholipase_D-nuclease N-terminal/Short C-terminal domain